MKSIRALLEGLESLAMLVFGLFFMSLFFALPLLPIFWLCVGLDSAKYERALLFSLVSGGVITLSLFIEFIFIIPYSDLELTLIWRQVTTLYEAGIYIPLFLIGILIFSIKSA